jgi:glycosyltransferase involved in cell wall biosynthesis
MTCVRVAWFSPMPPVRSGVAVCSAELIPELRTRHDIDVFVDQLPAAPDRGTHSAHDFLWRHRQRPYDLNVYQLGNSSHHDYLWPYLFRFPGLTVLHDAHLHHARAVSLLQHRRDADYRAEFAANHPDADAQVAELAIAGFDSYLYYMWPMTRGVIEASRLSAVHSRALARQLQEELETSTVEHIRLSHGSLVDETRERSARQRIRAQYGIASDAITFGCFGGLTADKRIAQILDAFGATLPYAPDARLLLAGAVGPHWDLAAAVQRQGLDGKVVITGYLETDAELTDCIAAVDVTLNLRWPTARETSGPWLRALAAGKPTIVMDLLQHVDVPALDPRTWTSRACDRLPVTVAIDILDEDHSLRLAMRRLARDSALRRTLGVAGRDHWQREHSADGMLADYERLMEQARWRPAPRPSLPRHLVNDGTGVLEGLLAPFGLPSPLSQTR